VTRARTAYSTTSLNLDEGKHSECNRQKKSIVRGMRNSTADTGRSLDLHCRPVYIVILRVSKTKRKRMPVQLKVCTVYIIIMFIKQS